MKRCPVCQSEYAASQQFCTRDGSRLIDLAPASPASPRMLKALLFIKSPQGEVRKMLIDRPSLSIGTTPDNSIQLPDTTASRHHAVLRWQDGHYLIIDTGSLNGVIVNGERIGEGGRVLSQGDIITIGRTKLTFQYQGSESSSGPSAISSPSAASSGPSAAPPAPPIPAPPSVAPRPARYQVKASGELSPLPVAPAAPAVSSAASNRGENLLLDGRYQLEEVLAQDAMGTLYRARRTLLDDLVAVRVLRPQLVSNQHALNRFRREAVVASRIRHPNAVQIHDFVASPEGAVYIVEELLSGQTLRDLIRRGHGMTLSRVINIFNQVCGAVHAAHLNGIVLRDLKPESIHLERGADGKEVVKVSGSGLAKIEGAAAGGVTMAGVAAALGAAEYMSPEQWEGEPLDSRSDVYSLGVILYEMLTGEVPYQGASRLEIAEQHLHAPIPDLTEQGRPDLDEAVASVVARALNKIPSRRPPTALHFAAEFQAAAHVEGGVFGSVIQKATGLLPFAPVIVPSAPGPAQLGEEYLPPVVAEAPEKGGGVFNPVVTALMVEAFLSRVSGGLIKTAVPLYALLVFGLDIASIMALVLIQNVVPLLLRPFFGSLADRYGKKRVFMISLVVRTVVGVLYSVATLSILFLTSAVRGIADSAKGPSASAMIADNTDERHIAKAYSWYTTTKSTSGSIGEAAAAFLLTALIALFIGSQVVTANVAVTEHPARPGIPIDRFIRTPSEVAVGGVLPGKEGDPPQRVLRLEQRQVRIGDVPINDLPNVIDRTPLRRALVAIFIISTVLSAFSLILVAVFIKEKKKDKPKKKPAKDVSAGVDQPQEVKPNVWAFALMGAALTAPAYMVSGEFFTLLAVKLNVTPRAFGWIKVFSETLVPLFFGPFFGWLADRIGASRVIAMRSVANLVTSALFWATSFFTGGALLGGLLGLARGLDEIGKAAFKPTWGAVSAKVSSFDLARRGRTMGILEGGVDSSDLIFPQIAGLIFQRFSLTFLMIVRALLAIVAEIYTFFLLRRYRI